MKKHIFFCFMSLAVFVAYSCSGINTRQNLNVPQIHFTTSATDGMYPVALIRQQEGYCLYYQTSGQTGKKNQDVFYAFSRDLIHWNPPIAIKLHTGNADLLYANIAMNWSEQSVQNGTKRMPLVALLLVRDKTGRCKLILNHSGDGGKTWLADTAKVSFPIAVMDNYKPGLVWDQFHSRWIITLANNNAVEFYSSENLRNWNVESALKKPAKQESDTWTRTTFFPVNKEDWALLVDQQLENHDDGSVIQYYTGTFDGHVFNNQSTKQHWLDYGKDNMYPVVYSCIPDCNPILIGLKSNICYTNTGNMQVWKESATLPCLLTIDTVYKEKMLSVQPVASLNTLIEQKSMMKNITLNGNLNLDRQLKFNGTPAILTLKLETIEMTRMNFPPTFGICLENDKKEKFVIGYNTFKRWYYTDRTNFAMAKDNPQFGGIQYMPCYHTDATMEISLVLDNNSLELFTEKGRLVMTENFLPQQRLNHLSLFAENGYIRIEEITLQSLKSIRDK